MLSKFKENLGTTLGRCKILAAVSGGVDSMVMASLLYECFNTDFAIATVNFKLRGKESDADHKLVYDWANSKGIKVFGTSFDTSDYAVSKGISIEMAARELRYGWFYRVMEEEGCEALAIAHNLNDSVETLFLNILRGTGIEGLGGIKMKTGRIVRPMLSFTRGEIMNYAQREGIPFREDSTNREDVYARNRIRNRVFPEFQMINPSFLRTIERDMLYFTEASDIIKKQLQQVRSEIIERDSSKATLKIRIDRLLSFEHSNYWLYMILSDYDFNAAQARQVHDSLTGQSGKEFHSRNYMIVKDRDYLLIYSKGESNIGELGERLIEKPSGTPYLITIQSQTISFRLFRKEKGFMPEPSKDKLYVDTEKIEFPLTCRLWRDGDRFIPLGMRGFKKLSDLFIDEKLDIKSKEHRLVLSDNDNIVAVLGHRIDDRYKITPSTKEILEIVLS
ncbi:MAG: tRNA lysidine(34) synthetase TilS [Rikenellaceae bacterium]|nr:tRNA lysidine(34) synthetase TilS [Rikenellaceae bacterium]